MNKFFTPFVFFLILLSSFGSKELSAQTNGGFENWEPSGSPPPFDWKSPVGWTTNNATTEFTSAGVKPSEDAHTGSFAAHLRTVNVFGTLQGAELFLGDCALSFPTYSVLDYTCGEPLTMQPQSVRFFYKLEVGGPFENGFAKVLIKRPSGGQFPDTVGYFLQGLMEEDQYTEIEIDISSADVNPATDSIVIGFVSNHETAGDINNLFVDDVSIDFTSANNYIPDPKKISLYPNPVHSDDPLTIVHDEDVDISEIRIVDATGNYFSLNDAYSSNRNVTRISTCGLSPGIYCIVSNDVKPIHFVIID